MASKRKKSRPTKIERDENLNLVEKESRCEIDDDPLTRIQRFIEEESEDTPDACSERINWSPVKKILGSNEAVAVSNNGIMNSEDGFPNIFTNGHIPSNLKFHQLKKDEVESLERRSADSLFPVSRFVTEVAEKFIIKNTLLQQGLNEPLVNEHNDDAEWISFKPVEIPLPNKSPSKRAKVTDDETPRYVCFTCKYVTNRSDHYKRHLMTHSKDKPLKCSRCSYNTGRSDHYKRHLQRHGLSEKDIIETCSRNGLKLKSTSLSALSDSSNGTKNNENMQELKQSNLRVEMFERVGQKRFKCQTCNYSTDTMSHYTRHQNRHTKAGIVHCNKCNKFFKSRSYFSQHKCGRLSERHCPQCRTIFIDRKAVLLHIARDHCDDDLLMTTVSDNPTLTESVDSVVDLTSDAARSNIVEVLEKEAKSNTPMVVSGVDKNGVDKPIIGMRMDNQVAQTTDDGNSTVITIVKDTPGLVVGSNPTQGSVFRSCWIVSQLSDILEDTPTCSQGLESSEKNDQTSENVSFVPKMPSARGNLGCTKCGAWFDKLNEYSSHACVS